MRNLLRVKLVVLALFFLCGCDDESLLQQQDFKQLVEKIAGQDETVPQESNLTNTLWKSSDWQINIYEGESKVGNWNNYAESMTKAEKNQTYRFADKKFTIQNTGQDGASASFDYQLKEKGELMINDVLFMAKLKGQALALYYNTVDAAAVAEIFKVTIDQTFGKSAQKEAGLLSMGIISLSGQTQTDNTDSQELSSHNLIDKFQKRQEMYSAVFNTLKVTDDAYTFTLTDDANSQSNKEQKVTIKDQSIDLSNITPERAKLLFEPFMKKQAFTFKGVDVMISKITHEDGSGNSFLVYGKTTANNEDVAFYYNTASDKEHWNKAPKSNSDLSAYDLVNKFQERQQMFDAVFNTLKVTDDAYTFTLTDDANSQSNKEQQVTIKDQIGRASCRERVYAPV